MHERNIPYRHGYPTFPIAMVKNPERIFRLLMAHTPRSIVNSARIIFLHHNFKKKPAKQACLVESKHGIKVKTKNMRWYLNPT
jgi:hypothetical protein